MAINPTAFMSERHDLKAYKETGIINPGDPWSVSIPTNQVWQVVSILFTLQTVGAANNRLPYVFVEDDSDYKLHYSYASIEQATGNTWTYYFTIGVAPVDMTALDDKQLNPLGCCYQLKSTDSLEVDWINRQIGDQLSEVYLRYFLWKEQ